VDIATGGSAGKLAGTAVSGLTQPAKVINWFVTAHQIQLIRALHAELAAFDAAAGDWPTSQPLQPVDLQPALAALTSTCERFRDQVQPPNRLLRLISRRQSALADVHRHCSELLPVLEEATDASANATWAQRRYEVH
jgi:hypothetical protein